MGRTSTRDRSRARRRSLTLTGAVPNLKARLGGLQFLAEVQKRYWRAPDLSRAAGPQVSLGHLFALLIVFAPGARCEMDQRAFAHKGDASPIAIDVPGGRFANEFAQRIAWAEARTFSYLNHGKSLQSLCRGHGSISFIRALHEFAISSLSAWDE